ncbi:helix-hairpin-helix domain-containing protein [Colwelliaceae bacterium 6471]
MRENIIKFTDIPNVGPATEQDFKLLGFTSPKQLASQDPYITYENLCQLTRKCHDPCVIDVFIAATKFMSGEPAQKWWYYTAERKEKLLNIKKDYE